MTKALWTARCKSGYTFNGKPCSHFTPRGVLICSDCLTAQVVPGRPGLVTVILTAIAVVLGVR